METSVTNQEQAIRNDSYYSLQKEVLLKQNDHILLEIYREGKTCRNDLVFLTELPINIVCRAIDQLKKARYIEFAGKVHNPHTRKENSIYQVTEVGKLHLGKIMLGVS